MRRSMAEPRGDAVDAAYVLGLIHGGLFGGIAALIGSLMAVGVWRWPWQW